MHFPLGPKESAPDIKLRNPSNLVDQFLLFVCAFLFIPHRAILCFPVHLASRGERPNWNDRLVTRCCVSHFNLMTHELPKRNVYYGGSRHPSCIPDSTRQDLETRENNASVRNKHNKLPSID